MTIQEAIKVLENAISFDYTEETEAIGVVLKELEKLKWEIYVERQETTEETEESNYGIQDRLSMILENQSEIKSDIKKILNR